MMVASMAWIARSPGNASRSARPNQALVQRGQREHRDRQDQGDPEPLAEVGDHVSVVAAASIGSMMLVLICLLFEEGSGQATRELRRATFTVSLSLNDRYWSASREPQR